MKHGFAYWLGVIFSGMAVGAAAGKHPNWVLTGACVILAVAWIYFATFTEDK